MNANEAHNKALENKHAIDLATLTKIDDSIKGAVNCGFMSTRVYIGWRIPVQLQNNIEAYYQGKGYMIYYCKGIDPTLASFDIRW